MIIYKCEACGMFPAEPNNGDICPHCCSNENTRVLSTSVCGNCAHLTINGCSFHKWPHGRSDGLPVLPWQTACGNWDPRP